MMHLQAKDDLRAFMVSHGVGVDEISAVSGVSRSAIFKFLSGKDLRLSRWEKIKSALRPDLYRPAAGAEKSEAAA